MTKKGFTLVEAMASLLALSIITVAIVRFNGTVSKGMTETSHISENYISEVQDVTELQTSDSIPVVNNPQYLTKIDSGVGGTLYKYSGQYITYYREME